MTVTVTISRYSVFAGVILEGCGLFAELLARETTILQGLALRIDRHNEPRDALLLLVPGILLVPLGEQGVSPVLALLNDEQDVRVDAPGDPVRQPGVLRDLVLVNLVGLEQQPVEVVPLRVRLGSE